jgi:AcrR family transcriptional regulator
MPGKQSGRSREEFVVAAAALVQEQGWSALTMRALGESMGIEHTIVYRYFPNKRALVEAVLDLALTNMNLDIASDDGTPRERVLRKLDGFRTMLKYQPYLGSSIMDRQTPTATGRTLARSIIDDLSAMGLDGYRLVCCYQALESLTIGSAIFDYSRAPEQQRYRQEVFRSLGHETFTTQAHDADTVVTLVDEAFNVSIAAVLDSFVLATD